MRRGSTKFSQGVYKPRNPDKYIGKGNIIYRSSWENHFCIFCDSNDYILEWASESVRIPYRHPLTGKQTTYVPDFLIRYRNKNDKVITELIEIKPAGQSALREGMNQNQRATVAVNHAKWAMARKWAKAQGITFRVVTEHDIFAKSGKRK
jgi:hypothetical protein